MLYIYHYKWHFFISWNAALPTEATHDSALHLKCQLRGPIGYRRCMYNLYGAFINMNPILNPNTDSINDVISTEIVESNEKSMQ